MKSPNMWTARKSKLLLKSFETNNYGGRSTSKAAESYTSMRKLPLVEIKGTPDRLSFGSVPLSSCVYESATVDVQSAAVAKATAMSVDGETETITRHRPRGFLEKQQKAERMSNH